MGNAIDIEGQPTVRSALERRVYQFIIIVSVEYRPTTALLLPINPLQSSRHLPSRRRLDIDDARIMGVPAQIHTDIGRVEIAVRPVKMAGTDAQIERIDLVGDAHRAGVTRRNAPGRLIDLPPGQRFSVLVGGGELLHMSGIITDQVRSRRPDRQRQIEHRTLNGMNVQRHIIPMGMRAQH